MLMLLRQSARPRLRSGGATPRRTRSPRAKRCAAWSRPQGKVDPALLEREQFAAHGFAWIATYVAALRQMRRWAEQRREPALGELEQLILQIGVRRISRPARRRHPMSQVEIVRPADLGLDAAALDTPGRRAS